MQTRCWQLRDNGGAFKIVNSEPPALWLMSVARTAAVRSSENNFRACAFRNRAAERIIGIQNNGPLRPDYCSRRTFSCASFASSHEFDVRNADVCNHGHIRTANAASAAISPVHPGFPTAISSSAVASSIVRAAHMIVEIPSVFVTRNRRLSAAARKSLCSSTPLLQ
jgi:hypothetical protein